MITSRVAKWMSAFGLMAVALLLPAHGQDRADAPRDAPTEPPVLQIDLGAHGGAVRRIAADSVRGLVVTGSDDKTARSWSLDGAMPLKVFRPPVGEGEQGRVYGVALHPTQPWVAIAGAATAAGGNAIHVYDVQTGQLVRRIDAHDGDIKRLMWTGDGAALVTAYAGANVVRAFDAQGQLVFTDTFPARVLALAVSQGRVAAASFDGSLRVYETGRSGMREPPIRLRASRQLAAGVASLAFSPDGRALAVGYMAVSPSSLGHAPDIVEWERAVIRSLRAPPGMVSEDLRAVAWLAPSGHVVAAGSYGYSRRDVGLVSYDAQSGQWLSTRTAARASITDIAVLPGDRLVYATADGSWGSADAHGQQGPSSKPSVVPDLVGAGHLRVSGDGRRISWNLAGDRGRVMFDLDRHTLHLGQGADLPAPTITRNLLSTPRRWEDFPDPVINGRSISLQEGERSRAVAQFAPHGEDAVLGTSRALYRIGSEGQVLWRVATHTEVRAVHVARQGQLIVTAMLDGTVRLWHSHDGKELLALLVLPDERWVAWTPSGYYDATPRAEDLIGWRVSRGRNQAPDFFHASRFKARFYRPDVIDHVLETLDETVGLRQANAEMHRGSPPLPLEKALPPVVELVTPDRVSTSSRQLVLRVRLRTADSAPLTGLWVRVNKQLQPVVRAQQRPVTDGTGTERDLTVTLPGEDAEVQVFAENRHGVAEPAKVAVRWTGPTLGHTPAAIAQAPNLYVLAIGVSAYRHVQPLKYAHEDALAFVGTMRGQEGLMYDRVVTKVLVNEQATRDEVVNGLDWLQRQVTQNDIAMIFISGHGVNDATMGYTFLPANADPGKLRSTGVPTEEIRRTVSGLAGKAVLFFDTCHAGNAMGFGRKAVNDMTGVLSELMDTENGIVVFSASTGRQFSHEHDDWKHGAFTKALIEGLAGRADANGSGRVTHTALAYFISERVKQLTGGEQSPVTSADNVADFPLARVTHSTGH